MGGLGSGNFYRWNAKDTCESYTRIELPYMRKRNFLTPGCSGNLSWSRRGVPSGNIGFRSHHTGLLLTYTYSKNGGERREVNEFIPYAYSEQRLGGKRKWLVCLNCRRKCSILYGGTHYRCRKCLKLAYQSQNEAPHYRALSQAQKFRTKLGGSECIYEPFPNKPKGMHRKTYERLRRKGEWLDERVEGLGAIAFGRLLND